MPEQYQDNNSERYQKLQEKCRIQGEFLRRVHRRSEKALSTNPLYPYGRGWWPLPQKAAQPSALETI